MNGSGVVSVRGARAPPHDAPTRTLGVTIATYATCTSFEPGIDRRHDFRAETKMTERPIVAWLLRRRRRRRELHICYYWTVCTEHRSANNQNQFVFRKRALRRGRPKLINEITRRTFRTDQDMADRRPLITNKTHFNSGA